MLTSEFIQDNNFHNSKELLQTTGRTSLSYKVCIDGKQYFMKRLHPELNDDPRSRLLFHKEFELGTSISNEHVVKYEKIREDENGPYIIMEYIYGSTIEEKLNSDKEYFTKEGNVWKLLTQLLEGLDAFHEKGIAYLDITPNNIMLTQVGNNVKIVDLGFCFNNTYGHTAGTTRGFAAPELLDKQINEIDERSDIYAVGCLMKEIQTRSGMTYSRAFQRIMHRCMNDGKTKRYASAHEMMRDIRKRNTRCNSLISIPLMAAAILFLLFISNRQRSMETISQSGVDYRILSPKEMTCEVTGGEGENWNIYIAGKVNIDGKQYRTTQVAKEAFKGTPIKSVYLPEGIETISNHAFADCDSVVTMYIPSTVKNINAAFCGMRNLKSIRIPHEMTTIGNAAFVLCTSLENIDIPEGVERINLDAFAKCGLKQVLLPSTLKVLERGVFYECDSLEEITIPASVEEIGDYIFYGCNKLKDVYNHAPTPQPINMIINTKGVKVHVPAAALEAYKANFNWSKYDIVGDL